MKKITVRVHTTDAEHWVTMNGAAVLVDGTEGGGFTVKGGAGGKLQGLKVNPKSMSEPRLNAKTSQFNRPDFKPHEPDPPKPVASGSLESGPAVLRDPKTGNAWTGRGIAPQWAKEMLARGEPLSGSVTQKPAPPAPAAKPAGFLGTNADPAAVNAPLSKRGDLNAEIDRHKAQQAAEAKTKAKESAATTRAEKAEAKALISEHGPAIVAKMGERFGAKSIEGMLDQWAKWEPKKAILFVNKFKAEQAAAQAAGSSQAAPSARQYISAAKLDHPSVGALNNATAQKEAAHARLKSINRKDDPLGHLKADSAHRDAVRNEASAREAVEAAANGLGQTTISPTGAKKAAGEAEKLGALKERIGGEAAKRSAAPAMPTLMVGGKILSKEDASARLAHGAKMERLLGQLGGKEKLHRLAQEGVHPDDREYAKELAAGVRAKAAEAIEHARSAPHHVREGVMKQVNELAKRHGMPTV